MSATVRGRLNEVHFVDEKTVKKIGVAQEEIRPSRLEVEAWALTLARKRGVSVPQILDYYRDTEGREVLILERVNGVTFRSRPSPEEAGLLRSVGAQMMLLGGASYGYGWIDPPVFAGRFENWSSFIVSYADCYGKRLTDNGVLGVAAFGNIQRAVEEHDFSLFQPYLLNRDLKPRNLLKDCAGRVWILDWENVILGDPLFDLAIFGVREGHAAGWDALRKGYGVETLPARYLLYEVVCLVGILNFYVKHGIRCLTKQRQLDRLIRRL